MRIMARGQSRLHFRSHARVRGERARRRSQSAR
jgi:hypothetical protein